METFTELSLFSGTGGGLLATQHLLGFRTVCYVEWDEYAIEVLRARIRDGYLHDAPIWDDAFTFDGRPWAGLVDVVSAGFPCQPFSVAGKGLAENDPRNGWPAVNRILREVRPKYALLENVPGLISKPYFRRILGDLAEAGFDIEQDCISAAEVGANHKRERLWIVAKSNDERRGQGSDHREGRPVLSDFDRDAQKGQTERQGWECRVGTVSAVLPDAEITEQQRSRDTRTRRNGFTDVCNEVSYPASEQSRRVQFREVSPNAGASGNRTREASWWEVEPRLGRVADGVANRVDRLRAIGNGQVPDVVREAWERLA